ncbi:diguanylate cyclase [Microbulbifer sp. SSSA002]|uniref:diguanylate cyclase n=1 Tax=unclassified Microbulbifer TaxID=2619833 RepID=UPI0040395273
MSSGYNNQNPAISTSIDEVQRIDLRRRILASSYMLIFAMAITGAMAIIALTATNILQASTLFLAAVVILLAYITVNIIGPSEKTPTLVGILLLVLYFYLLLTGGVNNTGLMWAVMLVPGFINLYGYKTGTTALLGIGLATAAILFYPDFPGLTAKYDTAYRARFIAVFGALTALTALLDSSRHQTQQLLQRLTGELESYAATDTLTGLANRREAFRAINELERRSDTAQDQYVILIGDLDNFKMINDTYGHSFGDRVLQDVAKILKSNSRSEDIVARWGGEEFLLLLPNTDLKGGSILAEKLRRRVAALSRRYTRPVKISISLGVVEGSANGKPLNQLLAEADKRMYRAKNSGRNKVIAA